nr:polymerase PB2 [Red mite quaranjavirus]
MGDPRIQAQKGKLLSTCTAIIKLYKGRHNETQEETSTRNLAIKLLKENPSCNKRVLAKHARAFKDPNPVASTMANISLKWPITISKDYIPLFEEHFPNLMDDLFPKQKKLYDVRDHKRVVCSRETLNLWIIMGQEPSDEALKMETILHKSSRDAVENYFSIPWGQASVSFGMVPRERRAMKTREPFLDVPRGDRTAVVAEILMPGYSPYPEKIAPEYLEEVAKELKTRIFTGLDLGSQAKILNEAMDEKTRVLPTTLDMPSWASCHSTNMFGTFWKLIQIPEPKTEVVRSFNSLRRDLNLIVSVLRSHRDERIQQIIVAGIGYDKRALKDIIEDVSESYSVQYIRTLLKLPCTCVHRFRDYEIRTETATPSTKDVTNLAGYKFRIYEGEEKIHFKKGGLKGSFDRQGQSITHIMVNRCISKELIDIMCMAANYCRYDWQSTHSKTQNGIFKEIDSKIKAKPRLFLGLSQPGWGKLCNRLNSTKTKKFEAFKMEGSNVILTVVEETTNPPDLKLQLKITKTGSLVGPHGRVPVETFGKMESYLSDGWDSAHISMLPILGPLKALRRTIEYHMNRPYLMKDIRANNFHVMNEHMGKFFSTVDWERISTCARAFAIAADMRTDIPLVYFAFLYTMAGCQQVSMATSETAQMHKVGMVDLRARQGVFIWSEKDKRFTVGGKLIMTEAIFSSFELSDIDLPVADGIILDRPSKRRIDCNYSEGVKRLKKMEDGARLTVIKGTRQVDIVKDYAKADRYRNTLKRSIQEVERQISSRMGQDVKRRRTETVEDPRDVAGPSWKH